MKNEIKTINILKLSYCHGRFLSHPKSICYGFKCHRQEFKLPFYCTSGYHPEVIYPTNVTFSTYMKTEAVAYPTGLNMDKILFTSYEVGVNIHYFYFKPNTHSWLSPIVYHINCSRPSNETADW